MRNAYMLVLVLASIGAVASISATHVALAQVSLPSSAGAVQCGSGYDVTPGATSGNPHSSDCVGNTYPGGGSDDSKSNPQGIAAGNPHPDEGGRTNPAGQPSGPVHPITEP